MKSNVKIQIESSLMIPGLGLLLLFIYFVFFPYFLVIELRIEDGKHGQGTIIGVLIDDSWSWFVAVLHKVSCF